MAKLKWVDVTSYRRDEERIPRTWELDLGELKIIVTRYASLEGWFLTCREIALGVSFPVELKAVGAIEAQGEAVRTVSTALADLQRAFNPAYSPFACCCYEDCDAPPAHETPGGARVCDEHFREVRRA